MSYCRYQVEIHFAVIMMISDIFHTCFLMYVDVPGSPVLLTLAWSVTNGFLDKEQ